MTDETAAAGSGEAWLDWEGDLAALQEKAPIMSEWRHAKGGLYCILGYCRIEATAEFGVLYAGAPAEDARWRMPWARGASEFFARFTRLGPPPPRRPAMTAETEAGALPLDCWAKCKAGLHAWQKGDTFTRCTDPRWCRMAAEPNAARWLDRVTPEIERIAQEAQRHMDANDRDKLRAERDALAARLAAVRETVAWWHERAPEAVEPGYAAVLALLDAPATPTGPKDGE